MRAWLPIAVAACGGPSTPPIASPAPPPIATVPPDAPLDAPGCVAPMQAGFEPEENPPDLDGDGRPDVVLVDRGAREPTHLLYVRTTGDCTRPVGRIDAFMLGCSEGRSDGLCNLWVDTWLMHGDRLRTTWSYDGTEYRKAGQGELVPGPRKRP